MNNYRTHRYHGTNDSKIDFFSTIFIIFAYQMLFGLGGFWFDIIRVFKMQSTYLIDP